MLFLHFGLTSMRRQLLKGVELTGDNGRSLVVDAHFESSRTPVHKLNGTLSLDCSYGSIDIFRHHVSSVQHAARHVLPMSGVTFHHLIGRIKAGVGDFSHGQLLMISFLSCKLTTDLRASTAWK